MPEPIAEIIVTTAALYAVAGLGFAAFFVSRVAGWAVRLILLPGAVLLWPLLLYRERWAGVRE